MCCHQKTVCELILCERYQVVQQQTINALYLPCPICAFRNGLSVGNTLKDSHHHLMDVTMPCFVEVLQCILQCKFILTQTPLHDVIVWAVEHQVEEMTWTRAQALLHAALQSCCAIKQTIVCDSWWQCLQGSWKYWLHFEPRSSLTTTPKLRDNKTERKKQARNARLQSETTNNRLREKERQV